MSFGIKLLVYGDYACFSRPEMKVERVSYDVITPSAARGILEAIHYKPAIKWHIDKIHVLNEIQFTNIRRNEISDKISVSNINSAMRNKAPLYINSNLKRQQRASLILRDVAYVIEAHFEMTEKAGPNDNPDKHYAIVSERIKKGRCFHTPCFGTREFAANFELCDSIPQSFYFGKEVDLGYMLWDMDYKTNSKGKREVTPIFYKAIMKDGIIDVANSLKVR